MKDNKLKKFWNDHKVAIIIAGGTILSVALVAVGIKCKAKPKKLLANTAELAENMDIPVGFGVGEVTKLWKEDDWLLNAIVNNITVDDIGRLGDEFVKQGIVPDGTKVTMVLGFI